jgi:nicotinamidase/pyrazinamidase
MNEPLFWDVDTQVDFMRPDGKLSVAGAPAIEPALDRLMRHARANKLRIVHTGDWHTMASPEISATPDFRTTFPPHCLQHSPGAVQVPATQPLNPYVVDWQAKTVDVDALRRHPGEILIRKDAFDAFDPRGGPHTDRIVEVLAPKLAVVFGVATNVCVDCAVRGLRKRGVDVAVPVDAIKELPTLPLQATLDAWRAAGATLTTVDDVLT